MEFKEPEDAPDLWDANICDIFAAQKEKIIKNGAFVAQVRQGEELSLSQIVEKVRETEEHRYF